MFISKNTIPFTVFLGPQINAYIHGASMVQYDYIYGTNTISIHCCSYCTITFRVFLKVRFLSFHQRFHPPVDNIHWFHSIFVKFVHFHSDFFTITSWVGFKQRFLSPFCLKHDSFQCFQSFMFPFWTFRENQQRWFMVPWIIHCRREPNHSSWTNQYYFRRFWISNCIFYIFIKKVFWSG